MRNVPTTYVRDDERQLITVTVSTPYDTDDILRAIDRQAAEDTWGYAMLYDLRAQEWTPIDSPRVAAHVKTVAHGRERGPVGLAIGGKPQEFLHGLHYTALTRRVEIVEVLLTDAQLEDWLYRNAPRRKRP